MQNRRTFLGSAATAGVGAAIGSTLIFPSFPAHAQDHAVVDPVMGELQKQLTETMIAIRKGVGRPGEHARNIAANIRLLTAHGFAAAADVRLRQLVTQEGRDALLARQLNPEMVAAELKVIGVTRVPTFSATYTDHARMLDATVTNGVAATLSALSAGFDRIAPVLDRHTSTSVVAVRQDVDDCWEWLVFLTGLESLSWEWCILGMSMCWLFLAFYYAWASFMCSLGCLCVV